MPQTLPPTTLRLNKFIAQHTGVSRRQADALIERGAITINGNVVRELGLKVDLTTQPIILLHGEEVVSKKKHTYIMLHKPKGVTVTRQDAHAERMVMDLLPKSLQHVKPVGRLDRDSEGLLLLSDDGQFINQLTHPSFHIEKEYEVMVRDRLDNTQLKQLAQGIALEEGNTGKNKVERLSDYSFRIILGQGWKRQLRRMVAQVGNRVVRLRRQRIGQLELGRLPRGQWQIVRPDHIFTPHN